MYKKTYLFLNFLCFVVLCYLLYEFLQVQNFIIPATEKVQSLNDKADDFINTGFAICLFSWITSNIMAVKSKHLFWLLMPFLFTALVSWIISWQAETIFIFNKQNGLWKGGFSLSYFFGIAIVIFLGLPLLF
jgi:hypothetical protein